MEPIVDGLEAEFTGRITIIRINANDPAGAEQLASYGLRGHPAFVVLDPAGAVSATFLGTQTVEVLRQAMMDGEG